jgi:hypothetical protein
VIVKPPETLPVDRRRRFAVILYKSLAPDLGSSCVQNREKRSLLCDNFTHMRNATVDRTSRILAFLLITIPSM